MIVDRWKGLFREIAKFLTVALQRLTFQAWFLYFEVVFGSALIVNRTGTTARCEPRREDFVVGAVPLRLVWDLLLKH